MLFFILLVKPVLKVTSSKSTAVIIDHLKVIPKVLSKILHAHQLQATSYGMQLTFLWEIDTFEGFSV